MRAVLVFCEGNHDVQFTSRSLGALAGASWLGRPIRELPSPFGPVPDPNNHNNPKVRSIIARRYSDRSLDDLRLQGAAHPPPPSFEAMLQVDVDDTVYALVRSRGDKASVAAIDLLNDFVALLGFGVDVKRVAAAFLFDADATGLSSRETAFAASHAAILSGGTAPCHGQWVAGKDCPVGLFVFHDGGTQTGTLEAILGPLVENEWPARWAAAGTYLDAHADPADPVSVKVAERHKAQICITGQFRFPGDPMTQVLGRDGLPASHFLGPASKALVDFLRATPW